MKLKVWFEGSNHVSTMTSEEFFIYIRSINDYAYQQLRWEFI